MLRSIKNLLIPHHANNHRAKILHNTSLVVIIIVLLFVSIFASVLKNTHPEILGVSYSISEGELINLVNAQRQGSNLPPLSQNAALDDAARRKASDMLAKNYWAHFAPDGTSTPWVFIKDSGYAYTYAGENLAKGFSDSSSVVSAWMGSQTHRDNILSTKFQDVGFAIVPGTLEGEETVLIVQMFGARDSAAIAQVNTEETPVATTPAQVEVASAVSEPSPPPVLAQSTVSKKPTIDVKDTSKSIVTAGLAFLVLVLILDIVIVEKRKIPRLVGHNLDHVMLILLFLLFVVLTQGGSIL